MNISTYESQIKALETGGGGGGGGGNITINSITPIVYTVEEEVATDTSKYYIPKTDIDRINQDPPIVLVLKEYIDDGYSSDILYLDMMSFYEGAIDSWQYKPTDMENSNFLYLRMLGPGEYVLGRLGASDEANGVYDSATDSYVFTVVFM